MYVSEILLKTKNNKQTKVSVKLKFSTWFYRSLKTGEDAERAHSGGGGEGRQVRSQLVCPEQGEVPPSTSYLLSVTLSTMT